MSTPIGALLGNIPYILSILALVIVVLRFYKVRSLVNRFYRWFSQLWESDKKEFDRD